MKNRKIFIKRLIYFVEQLILDNNISPPSIYNRSKKKKKKKYNKNGEKKYNNEKIKG